MNREQARKRIEDLFHRPFDRERYLNFMRQLLKDFEPKKNRYHKNALLWEKFWPHVNHYERFGTYSDPAGNRVDLLIVEVPTFAKLERARATLRNLAVKHLKTFGGKEYALVAYYAADDSGADWRFSFVKIEDTAYKDDKGKVKLREDITPARRCSFLVGAHESSHTAQSRLVGILQNDQQDPTLEEIENAFNIESVTKEFFLEYRDLFLRVKEALDVAVEGSPAVKADFKKKGVDTVNFAKKLLGQILFLYFLQKKGWFGVGRNRPWGTGPKNFLRQLFRKAHGGYANFFNDILEPLFYEALRLDRGHEDHYYSRFDCKIPFLNGGLFDPVGGYDWVNADILLPDDLFSNETKTRAGDTGAGILDVFDRYNFTVKEDEPLEREVAIDPELLGKAYEKFNAIRPDNFDEFTRVLKSGKTGEENRFNKKFGVYYTPREIVHYMCRQSLIQYLGSTLDIHKEPVFTESASQLKLFGDKKPKQRLLAVDSDKPVVSRQDIEDLIEVGELITEHEATALIKQEKIKNGIQKSTEYTALLPDSIRKNAKLIDDLLADITVCDPAVGSGAFPVGMMNEIVRARNVLSVFLKNKGNTDIPVCALEDKGNTDIPVCDLEDKGNTDIPVCDSLHKTRRNLPHWTKEGSIYWITFRLADSLPPKKLNGWKAERDYWVSKHRKPWSETEWKEYDEQFGKRLEGWLDSGHGSCELAKPEIRKILQECLFRFNKERLRLHAAVIMPNHVHLLLEPLAGNSLPELLKGIKGASSRKINQVSGTTGTKFWMDESYDHIVRSEDQYQHFIQYIAENPVKANLSEDKYWLYIEGETGIPACDPPQPQIDTQTRMSVPRSSYEFKRRSIEHSLYGVDIDPGAVEIAKLRLWLSLVVDEEDIKNIKPLPNLDYRIVCGNSLVGVEKGLFNSHLFIELKKLKPLFFNETNPARKQEYKGKIDSLISQITSGRSRFNFEAYFSEVFHNSGGFDITIGNPPYVRQEQIKDIKPELKKVFGPFFCGTADLYTYFYKKGLEILHPKGHLCFIAPNKFMRAAYGKNTRRLLANEAVPKMIIDFGDLPVFDATTYPSILLVGKKGNGPTPGALAATLTEENQLEKIEKTLSQVGFQMEIDALDESGWNLERPEVLALMGKLKAAGVPLGEYVGGKFYYGIKTGLNSAFVIDDAARERLIAEDPKSAELIKPWLRGRDIKRWKIDWAGLYVIFTRRGVNIENYPAIKKYLEQFREDLEPKKSAKDKRGRKPGTYKWYEIQDNIAYYKEFERPKIVWGNLAIAPKFAIDFSSGYVSAPANIIPLNDPYLLALLNSKVCKWMIGKQAAVRSGGFLEYKPMYVENLPVPPISKPQMLSIKQSIENLLADPDNPEVPKLEREIDTLVYDIYGLGLKEIEIIENKIAK